MDILIEDDDDITLRFGDLQGSIYPDTVTIRWDTTERRLVVTAKRPDDEGRSGDVHSVVLDVLPRDRKSELRDRFESVVNLPSLDQRFHGLPLVRLFSGRELTLLVGTINGEFGEIMDRPIVWHLPETDNLTMDGLFDLLMQRVDSKDDLPTPTLTSAQAGAAGTLGRLVDIVAIHLEKPRDDVAEVTDWLWEDLGTDSLDVLEIIMMAEEEFGIEIDDDLGEATASLADLASLIDTILKSKKASRG